MEPKQTSMRISRDILDKLDKIKIHPNQPYEEVVDKLIDHWKRNKK